mgnify:CR=1 FL=1
MITKFSMLYVDDEVDNLTSFRAVFRRDFDLTILESPVEALSLIAEKHFDIVLSDQRMPKMSGVEFLEKLARLDPDSVRILITGYTDLETAKLAINNGQIFYYLNKPWGEDEIRSVLLKAVDHSSLLKENKELIKKLYRAVEELEIFLYRASHDLRAPISSQLGLINLLKYKLGTEEAEFVEKMEEAVAKLLYTIGKIDQLSVASVSTRLENTYTTISDMITSVASQLEPDSRAQDINVQINCEPGIDSLLPSIKLTKLQTIFFNIIENSIVFHRSNPERKLIKIDVTRGPENSIVLSVWDNGIGISQDQLPLIFTAFYRGNEYSKGNGLGLYIVRKIADSIGAKIDVSSEEGVYTQISISVPIDK